MISERSKRRFLSLVIFPFFKYLLQQSLPTGRQFTELQIYTLQLQDRIKRLYIKNTQCYTAGRSLQQKIASFYLKSTKVFPEFIRREAVL